MTEIHDHSGPPPDDLLAAEYALGVLTGVERAAVERRIAQEAEFAQLVADWEQRLAPWAGEVAEVAPPPAVWETIATKLPAQQQERGGFWQKIAGNWRNFALAAALAAACVGAFFYEGSLHRNPPLVAAIEASGNRSFVATIDTRKNTVTVVPAAFTGDATRVPELWLIPAGGKPIAVGLVDGERTVVLPMPATLMAQAKLGATLAVSLEPPGGSPTGAPTGPVIGAGKLTSL